LQFAVLVAVSAVTTPLLGGHMARVFGGGTAPGDRIFRPVERLIYRATGVDHHREQRWSTYARSLLAFSAVSVLLLYLLQRVQGSSPVNPTDMGAMSEPLAFNTAVSFTTNTNWQNFADETTMSHFTQMAGAGSAELRVRGRGHSGRHRPRARSGATALVDHRQLLG
jgi:K+-transporting ATPase ATPase A chain